METTYDTGLIYSQEFFVIKEYDNVKTVYDKVAKAAVYAIEKHLEDWTNGVLDGKKQDDSAATYYRRRCPDDGRFDFSQESVSIYNQIRGQTRPYPGAFFYLNIDGNEKKVYVWDAYLGDCQPAGSMAVKCADGRNVYLCRVQIDGEPEAWAIDCLKGIL